MFHAYTEKDIMDILEKRFGKKIVDHKALELVAKNVAKSSGDARRALSITSNAVEKAVEMLELDDNEKDKRVRHDECMPLVKLPHMARAIRESESHLIKPANIIAGLPQSAKVILCIAISLSQVWGPTAEISLSVLKKYCAEATHHAVMEDLSMGQVGNVVELLIDSGLLITDGYFNRNDSRSTLKIGVQLDEVEIGVEQTLLKEGGFYKRLVDYVKSQHPCPPSPCYHYYR